MSTNSSPPTRRSVLKIAATGGALGLIASASSSIVSRARCGHCRRQRDPPLPHQHSGSGARRSAPAHQRNEMARTGNGRRRFIGCAACDDAGTLALLGNRLRLAQDRGEIECAAAVHHTARPPAQRSAGACEEERAGLFGQHSTDCLSTEQKAPKQTTRQLRSK